MELSSELKINIIKNEEKHPLKFNINSPNVGGLISLHSGEFKDIPIFDNIILRKNPFIRILRFSLQIAIALFYDNCEVTRSILAWIVKISEQLKGKEEKEFEMVKKLYNYASRMLEQFNAFIEREKSALTLVPELNIKSYKEYLNRLIGFAKDYESQYKDTLKQERIDKQKVEKLKNKLLDHKDITEVHEFLEEVENKQFELSQNVRKEIEKDQKLAAQKELFFAVLDLSLSIGKVVIQPRGVFNFVDTIKKVSESVQNVLKNMDIKGIRDLVNTTEDEDVKKDLELAKDLNKKMNKELGYFGPESLNERLETGPKGGVMLGIYWETIKNNINKLYEVIKPIEQNIKGAEEYFNYSTELVNFIDAYIKAKIDENERSKEYSQIQKQVEINNRIKERLEQRIESKIQSQNDEIKLLLFEHLINIKYCMTLFMEKYRNAYKYRYLSESNLKLSVIKEFDEKDIIRMIKDLEDVSKSKPQKKRPTFEFKGEYVNKFKQNKTIKIDITPDNDKLNEYTHLRLHAFRVYLKGVGITNELIKLSIR
ncbi:hypothetical protein F8M41_009306 [Gigaspora margarita]|uniref:Uncharacterized protein n=1 Tax=Gigaspora margarita TaxID=4874 RepID=A0A8H4B462_GIGMA|nr:hypothetical protein F8M41_009306 [Gigaspora margarita]